MRSWDSVTEGGSLRPGPAALAILLTALVFCLRPVSQPIENGFYDLVQRLQGRTGSPQLLLVDTRKFDGAGTVWDADRFPDLLHALGSAGARLVLPVDPPPLFGALPDSAQLATLAEMERRTRSAGDVAATGDAFGRQLADMRKKAEQYSRTVEAIGALRNAIIPVPTFEGSRSASGGSPACAKHMLAGDVTLGSPEASAVRNVRAVAPPPRRLCEAALGSGYVEFWPDSDGIVRRLDLLISSSGSLITSAVLRAAMAVTFPSGKPLSIEPGQISWDAHAIRTTDGPSTLIRYYGSRPDGMAFDVMTAEDLLRSNAAAKRVSGRIVLLGHATPAPTDSVYSTPMAAHTSTALLLATGISNILQQDYLVRPGWLHWLELGLLLIVGAVILLWGRAVPGPLAVMIALIGATAVLAIEAYLLLGVGIWLQMGTLAAFTVVATAVARLMHGAARGTVARPALAVAAAGAAATPPARPGAEDELDLAFSMLRHQTPSDHVKQRLYDIALEHARRRDLAKAERVLRHLAGVDPSYRQAGDKLKKLAGLRSNAAVAANAEPATPAFRPVLQPPTDAPSLTGQTIGRYEIEQPIGRGAMATVYLGRDPKINRRVAIKTIALAQEFSDSDLDNARTQFLREAESAGRLNHPNIISIYDAGEDAQVAYLAMEFFPGKSLSYYAQHGNLLAPKRVLELMARAADALHYAHGQHVVHRDVKPANLLYDRETDTLKITDFGIARLTDTSRTKTGIILGTPSYMSPEQLAGTNVSGQSDLFSLGITMYQLLTGNPPFRADSIPRLMQKIAHEPHAPVTRERDDLPACLDEIFDRALAKDPADRFPSGRAMALALRECCSRFDTSSPARSS